jgi:hypothetical protein
MIGHTNYWVQYLTPPQQQNMPVGVKSMTIRHGYDGRGNAAILQLGIDACAATAAVQEAPPAERAGLLARALDLRTRELEAWSAFRTPEMPDGDKVGMSAWLLWAARTCTCCATSSTRSTRPTRSS